MGRTRALRWAAGLAVLALAVPGGCTGESTDRRGVPRPVPMPARGLDASNETEVESLVKERTRLRSPTCRLAGRPAPGRARFRCSDGDSALEVVWQHYGTGEYSIRDGSKEVARGVLSITE